jgi:DNA-binding NarL/FixJ family response regulator
MRTLIIIDDHDLMRQGLAACFSAKKNWRLLGGAGSSAEAERLFVNLAAAKKIPDLALLDIDLNGDWGLELVPRLKHFFPDIKILVYSVFDDFAHIRAAMRAGAAGYVAKSQSAAELEAAMTAVLDGLFSLPAGLSEKFSRAFDLVSGLTRRERDIFGQVQQRRSNRQIAEALGLTLRTVENNLSIIYDKTGVKNRQELEKL